MKAGEQKGLMMGIIIAVVVIVGGLWATGYLDFEAKPLTYYPGEPAAPAAPAPGVAPYPPAVEEPCRGLAATPTLTLKQVDRHNPSTTVTNAAGGAGVNMYRTPGSSWTDVANGGTIQKSAGTVIELVSGIDSDDETANNYCPYYPTWTMPCVETKDLVINCGKDALQSDLTGVWYDQYGRPDTIQVISAGDVKNMGFSFTGKYERDYGNIYCGGDPTQADYKKSNYVVIKYNATTVDEFELTSIERTTGGTKSYSVESVGVPTGIAGELAASGFTIIAYRFPVIESANEYKGNFVLDIDDTNEIASDQTDLYIYLYDSTWFYDGDAGTIEWGPEDEDQTNIGAATKDTIQPDFS